jgi:hypothetical protein
MKNKALSGMSEAELVALFMKYAVDQDDALLGNEIGKVNKLYWKITAIKDELKSRPGDGRRALVPLFDHPNPQVQVKAAKATLALVPVAARQVLESLQTCRGPQQLEAGMTLAFLDDGTFKPT